jgi:hypothetical protein
MEDGEKATSHRKGLLTNNHAATKPKAVGTCGWHAGLLCWWGVLADLGLKLLLVALGRGPLETGFEPSRCGRGIVSPEFANFVKRRASRMQTRC